MRRDRMPGETVEVEVDRPTLAAAPVEDTEPVELEPEPAL
jgi:hypothetical protein